MEQEGRSPAYVHLLMAQNSTDTDDRHNFDMLANVQDHSTNEYDRSPDE
jgi:hypothetical protein